MPARALSDQGAARPDRLWQSLRLLTFYRAILAGLLVVLHFALRERNPFNVQIPALFDTTLLAYLAFGVAAGFSSRLRWPGLRFQARLQVLTDIGVIVLLMHATGGVTSALGVLLVTAVTAGSLIVPGRLAYLFAAVATLGLLFETGLARLSALQPGAEDITRAGLLGLVLFAAAGLAHVLAARIRESEALAERRGVDLANLEQLNQYVIGRLQSGILVVDHDNRIRLANDTARTMLALDDSGSSRLAEAASELAVQLQKWKNAPDWQPDPIRSNPGAGNLIPRFSRLQTSQGPGALIILEDSAHLARQTQQVKLAALGRLTASIAHEIRNPLGAISHAAQLLGESEHLEKGDRRLTEIISSHAARLNAIIENVLQLSRRGSTRPQELALGEWLTQFARDFAETEAIAPARLHVDVEPTALTLSVDPGHLHQVLMNLCQNAFRHAGAEARVQIEARVDDSGHVALDVVDTGSGIDTETANQMFEPFYTTAASGTGLGLYIARELCEINRARLSYLAGDRRGSCFRIQFLGEQGF